MVAGDLNDAPESPALRPLLTLEGLHDVLALQFPNPADRWTYHYTKNEQIDYLLVSEPMKLAWRKTGLERRGIYESQPIFWGYARTISVGQKFRVERVR